MDFTGYRQISCNRKVSTSLRFSQDSCGRSQARIIWNPEFNPVLLTNHDTQANNAVRDERAARGQQAHGYRRTVPTATASPPNTLASAADFLIITSIGCGLHGVRHGQPGMIAALKKRWRV
jgi:hypothetical protein